MSEIVL